MVPTGIYIVSHGARVGRNFGKYISRGKITVNAGKEGRLIATVKGGEVVSTEYSKGSQRTVIVYGKEQREYKRGRLVQRSLYRPGSNRALRPTMFLLKKYSRSETLFHRRGTAYQGRLTTAWQNHTLMWERFTYQNGQVAYYLHRRHTKAAPLIVRGPEGQVLLETSPVSAYGVMRLFGWWRDAPGWRAGGNTHLTRILRSLFRGFPPADDALLIRVVRAYPNLTFKSYTRHGRLHSQGQCVNQQRTGMWRSSNGRRSWWLMGVEVSQQLHDTPATQRNPQEVLQIPNAQLRAALLAGIGMEQVVAKCGGKILDQTPNGEALFAIPTHIPAIDRRRLDTVVHILKVVCPSTQGVYYLRVPPTLTNCKTARLWTLGVEPPTPPRAQPTATEATEAEAAVQQAIELVKET